jgi:hypothetical protein
MSANRSGNGSERETRTERQRRRRKRHHRVFFENRFKKRNRKNHALAVAIPFQSLRSLPLPKAVAGEATVTSAGAFAGRHLVAVSNAYARRRTLHSSRCRPTICSPTGNPLDVNPAGTEIAGLAMNVTYQHDRIQSM